MNHIKNWKFFIVRNVIQDKFRLDTIQNLAGDQCLIIMDGLGLGSSAVKYREKQTDWFG